MCIGNNKPYIHQHLWRGGKGIKIKKSRQKFSHIWNTVFMYVKEIWKILGLIKAGR